MTGFFPLLRLQLLSRFADFKPKNLKTALAEKRGRTVGMIIAILFLVLYLGGILIFLEQKALDVFWDKPLAEGEDGTADQREEQSPALLLQTVRPLDPDQQNNGRDDRRRDQDGVYCDIHFLFPLCLSWEQDSILCAVNQEGRKTNRKHSAKKSRLRNRNEQVFSI